MLADGGYFQTAACLFFTRTLLRPLALHWQCFAASDICRRHGRISRASADRWSNARCLHQVMFILHVLILASQELRATCPGLLYTLCFKKHHPLVFDHNFCKWRPIFKTLSLTDSQAIGYASQHTWCLSQARINWEGCVRKGILRKNGGDGRGGGTN